MGEKLFLIAVLLVVCHSQTASCPGLVCDLVYNNTGTCVTEFNATTNTSMVSPCAPDYTCNSPYPPTNPELYNLSCTENASPTPAPYSLLAGIQSSNPTLCRSGNIVNGYCTGNATGVSCVSTSDCAAGLWCNLTKGQCQETLPYGSQCSLVSGLCKRGSVCTNGICLAYYSLPNGSLAPNCAANFDIFCQSSVCASFVNQTKVCVPPMPSANTVPVLCTQNANCTSAFIPLINGSNNGTCKCGTNEEGNSYCNLFPGDYEYYEEILYAKGWFVNPNYDSCNIEVDDLTCAMNWWTGPNYDLWAYFDYMSSNLQSIIDAPDCVIETYYPDYDTYYNNFIEAQSQLCPALTCESIPDNVEVCMFQYNPATSASVIAPCASNYTCESATNPTQVDILCVENESPAPNSLLPGVKSSNALLCKSGNVANGYCTGNALNTSCEDTSDCDAGLWCDYLNNTCQPTVPYGGDCSDFSLCQRGSQCEGGVCVEQFSLENGAAVESCSADFSNYLCKSASCATLANGDSVCVAPITSSGSVPMSCESDSDCTSNVVTALGTSVNGVCLCGTNTFGNRYCSLFPGDKYPAKYFQSLQEWMQQPDYDTCNFDVSDLICAMNHWDSSDVANLQFYAYMQKYQSTMVGAIDCLEEVFYPAYESISTNFILNQCPALTCAASSNNTGVCVSQFDIDTLGSIVTPCEEGYTCENIENPTLTDITCVENSEPITPLYSLLPGIRSYYPLFCRSGQISNEFCQGNATNVACVSTSDCAPGLWCSNLNNTCQPVIAVGQSCILKSAPCVRGSQCYLGVCTQEYSLAVGTKVPSCSSDFYSNLCASGSCFTFSNGSAVCVESITSVGAVPVLCTSNADCVSNVIPSLGGLTVTGTCSCGANSEGNSYCSLFPGDSYSSRYRASNITWMNSPEYDSCNINVDDITCANNHWNEEDLADLNYYQYMSTNLVLLSDASDCIQEVFFPEFQTIANSYIANQCAALTCASVPNNVGVCVSKFNLQTFTSVVTQCASGYICQYPQNPTISDITCEQDQNVISEYSLLAGIKTNNATLCRSGKTENGVCTGNATNTECQSTADCAPGLWCDSFNDTCQPTVEYGQSCKQFFVNCKRGSQCFEGVCTREFTLPTGTVLESCSSDNFDNLCESGSCGTFENGTSVCVPAITSSGTVPMQCMTDDDCTSNYVEILGQNLTGTCLCGSNTQGLRYCTLWPGDKYPTQATETYISWKNNSNYDNCNLYVDDVTCAMNQWTSSGYAALAYFYYLTGNSVLMTGAPACIMEVFYPEYQGIYNNYLKTQIQPFNPPKFESAWILQVSLIALGLLV